MLFRSSDASARLLHWRGALSAAVIISLPLAAAVMFIKYGVVWNPRRLPPDGWRHAASLFSADVIETVGLMPLALVLLFGWLPNRSRMIAMVLTTGLITTALALGWLSYLGVGSWPSLSLVRDFVGALGTDAGLVDPAVYIGPGRIRAAATMVLAAMAPLLLANSRMRDVVLGQGEYRRWSVALPFLVVLIAVFDRLGSGKQSELGRGTLSRMLTGLAPVADRSTENQSGVRDWSSLAFANSVDADRSPPPRPPEGRACRSAVMIILETASDRDYSWDTLRAAMPLTRWYLDHAIVPRRHFSSHVRSNRSDFTILSGIYDVTGAIPMQTYLRQANAPSSHAPGIAGSMRKAGFELRYYLPSRFTYVDDEWAIGYFGFASFAGGERLSRVTGAERRAAIEGEMFDKAANDVRAMTSDKPFFLVLRTMIGHDPAFSPRTLKYLDPANAAGRGATYRDVLGFVDSLLHKVIVAASQRLDSSRIAVAIIGDHGVRNFLDPDLGGEPFPLVEYRVPAVIGCPSLFDGPIFTNAATSHVDVAPTLEWVLGMDPDQSVAQGLVMTDQRLEQRFSFLFAGTVGVDAIIHGDTITAVNRAYDPPFRVLVDSSPTKTTRIGREAPVTEAQDRFNGVSKLQYRLIAQLRRKSNEKPEDRP